MGSYSFIGCFILSILVCRGGFSQDYLKTLDGPEKYFHQKIIRFPNGDLLIGDSSTEALNSGGNGKILLTRLDNCGQVEWSFSYETIDLYVEFRDFKITAQGEIIVFGSAYQGFDERVFLLKVHSDGSVKRFKLFNTGTVDHFTYNLDLKGGQLLAYGLLLDWNVQKQGFVALFDDELNYQWGKRFTPFVTGGEGIISEEGGFMCRSGRYLYKLNPQGELDWASINTSIVPAPLAGPIAVNGGYVFESIQENLSFFFKLDNDGKLVWVSPKFPSANYAADIKLQADGNLFAVYSSPGLGENFLCYLILSPEGKILQQSRLQIDRSFHSGDLDYTLADNGYLSIAGNAAAALGNPNTIADFILQSSINGPGNDCFQWEDFQETLPNDIDLTFMPLDTSISDLNMSLFQEEFQIEQVTIKTPLFQNECNLAPDGNQVRIDTSLQCGENWLVKLPSPDFIWLDNGLSAPRLLEEIGSYRASNRNCVQPVTYTYTLQREACQCSVFLPNALSPNNDSYNDQLTLFSNCSLVEVQMTVFSRWGDKLFESRQADIGWDGSSNGKAVPPGLYVVMLRYQLMNEVGEMEEGELVQEVMLLR